MEMKYLKRNGAQAGEVLSANTLELIKSGFDPAGITKRVFRSQQQVTF
jgi:hypothetical protein